jgi:acyl dehydratase
VVVDRDVHTGGDMKVERSLTLTGARLRAYSRRGNFHSDDDAARELGLPGLVAQGMQVAAPAYGALLDTWGEAFLARGVLELKFVGMVLEDETVTATVDLDDSATDTTDTATLEVTSGSTGRTAVVGTASVAADHDELAR